MGKPVDLIELKRREVFERRCCSLQKKHLDKHYREMLKLFYQIGVDANLKHVFLTSIPKELSQTVERTFLSKQRMIQNVPLEEIQQKIHLCLEELCIKRQMIQTYVNDNRELDTACSRQRLKIKCSNKDCDGSCEKSSKKNKHFKKL